MARKAQAPAKKPNGRPRKEIDLKLFTKLSAAGCSLDEIASMLRNSGCQIDMRTLKRRLQETEYQEARNEGFDVGKAKLRSNMVAQSEMMNSAGVQMSIHLSRQWLGMTEKAALELTGKNGGPVQTIDLSKLTNEQIDQLERIASTLTTPGGAVGGDTAGADAAGS